MRRSGLPRRRSEDRRSLGGRDSARQEGESRKSSSEPEWRDHHGSIEVKSVKRLQNQPPSRDAKEAFILCLATILCGKDEPRPLEIAIARPAGMNLPDSS